MSVKSCEIRTLFVKRGGSGWAGGGGRGGCSLKFAWYIGKDYFLGSEF